MQVCILLKMNDCQLGMVVYICTLIMQEGEEGDVPGFATNLGCTVSTRLTWTIQQVFVSNSKVIDINNCITQ